MDSSVDPLIQTLVTFGLQGAGPASTRQIADAHFQNELAALLADETDSPSTVSIPSNNLAALNNNPGNLRFAHQTGAIPGAGGFAQFGTPEAGYQALVNQVSLDASRGETLGQYITKYAPPSENDTARYIAQASQALEVDADTPLASLNPDRVAAFQAYKESGATVRR